MVQDDMNTQALLDRAAGLKAALVSYACTPGFARRLEQTLARVAGNEARTHDHVVDAVESLLFERDADGREPLLDHYLRTNKNMPPQDRRVYEDWRDDNVFGVFRVNGRRGVRLSLTNLIDELDYDVYATVDAEAMHAVVRGCFVATRIVPIGEIWTISGTMELFQRTDQAAVNTLAAAFLEQKPWLAYRNPEKLHRARTVSRQHHQVFLDVFGSNVIRGTGSEVLGHYRMFLNACGARAVAHDPAAAELLRPAEELAPAESFPPEILRADDVALYHHPVKSVSFIVEYGVVADAHRTPPTSPEDLGARRLREYLEDATIPAYVLADLAEEYPETVDALYQTALSLPHFHWKDDGEDLLRRHKPEDFRHADLPTISFMPAALQDARRTGGSR